MLIEEMNQRSVNLALQVFATDISDAAIEHGRSGLYSDAIAADVSPDRLRRFFTRVDGNYRVNRQVRDACVFARQDLTRDPPFSRLDVIVCRNVLIYMSVELQTKLMAIFHYALKSSGFLVLGSAETVGVRSDLFAIADKRHRIYEKKLAAGDVRAVRLVPPVVSRPWARDRPATTRSPCRREPLGQERWAPPRRDRRHFNASSSAATGAFRCRHASSHHALKMRKALHGLRAALQAPHACARTQKRLRVRTATANGREVAPSSWAIGRTSEASFVPPRAQAVRASDAPPAPRCPARRWRVPAGAGDQPQYLQSIIQVLEAANELQW
jgi:hypothetical protein